MAEIRPTMTDDDVMDFVANGYVVLDEMVDPITTSGAATCNKAPRRKRSVHPISSAKCCSITGWRA